MSFVTDEQINDFVKVGNLTSGDIEKIKKLKNRITRPVVATKNQVEVELLDYDMALEEASDFILFLNLLKNTKQKKVNDIFLPEWKKSRAFSDSMNKIRTDLESDNATYRILLEELSVIKDWIDYFTMLHWIFKSRIDNLRILHSGTY